jgi:hypothetical protein
MPTLSRLASVAESRWERQVETDGACQSELGSQLMCTVAAVLLRLEELEGRASSNVARRHLRRSEQVLIVCALIFWVIALKRERRWVRRKSMRDIRAKTLRSCGETSAAS